MSTYLIYLNGSSDTPESYGASDLRLSLSSLAPDTLSFSLAGSSGDPLAATIFAEGDRVELTRDGTRIFMGRIMSSPRYGAGSAEGRQVVCQGPWAWLEHIIAEQTWSYAIDGTGTTTTGTRGRIILGQAADGSPVNRSAVITEAVNFARSKGAPITIGTLPDTNSFPWREMVDVTCAEAIKAILRWTPDCISWFDYSGAVGSNATLHFRRRADLPTKTISLAGTGGVEGLDIQAREDLLLEGVTVRIERTHTYDEKTWNTVETQTAGDTVEGDPFRQLSLTVSAGGAATTTGSTEQECYTSPINATDINWWKQRIDLGSYATSVIAVLEDSHPVGDDYLGHELIDGSVPQWLAEGQGGTIKSGDRRIVATIALNDGYWRRVECTVSAISAGLYGVYSQSWIEDHTDAEPVPTGLASAVFDSLKDIQYEGSLTIVAEEPDFSYRPGYNLLLTGGLAAWGTGVGQMIQTVEHQIDQGRTSLRFGPPSHLGVQDILELARASRGTTKSTKTQARADAEFQGIPVVMPKKTANSNASSSNAVQPGSVYVDTAHPNRKIKIHLNDVQAIPYAPSTLDIKLRSFFVCENGSSTKSVIMLSSENYGYT